MHLHKALGAVASHCSLTKKAATVAIYSRNTSRVFRAISSTSVAPSSAAALSVPTAAHSSSRLLKTPTALSYFVRCATHHRPLNSHHQQQLHQQLQHLELYQHRQYTTSLSIDMSAAPATAAPAASAAFEERAAKAEALYAVLTEKVAALQGIAESREIERLEAENAALREQVAEAKAALIAKQVGAGKQHVPLPGESVAAANPAAAATAAASVAQTTATISKSAEKKAAKKAAKEKAKAAKAGGGGGGGDGGGGGGKGAKNKGGKGGKGQPAAAASAALPLDVTRLDFRIGKITKCAMHPDAAALYLETVDVGEPEPRTVISGLAKHVPLDQMQGRMVLLLCNLKPQKLRGILSQAMVMCTKDEESGKVEIIAPPADAIPGDLVHFEGYERTPDKQLNPKRKVYDQIKPDLITGEDGTACYKGVPFAIPGKGVCKSSMGKTAIS